ncbi:MAG: ABC transporter ATP-binding protein [Maricaulaceae bacterium]
MSSKSNPAENTQNVAIRAQDLSKHYLMYKRPEDRLKQMVVPRLKRLITKKAPNYYDTFVAVSDISLEIKRGETVGIVGRNGSGKSTLLQMICGTLQPTTGEVEVKGRIAALLELGAGFNPEFTGRENVYMNGAIIGMSRAEIDERFDAITKFADIGAFIEQPTKTYSSGMYVRLAFAVAINSDPDILIIDEALSVGDEAFQRKCFARIEDIQSSGATVLFVSHSAQSIVQLCDRAILLDKGECLLKGTPKTVVGQYQRLVNLSGNAAVPVREQIKNMVLANDAAEAKEDENCTIDTVTPQVTTQTELRKPDPSWFDPGLVSKSAIKLETKGATIYNAHITNADGETVNHLASGRQYRFNYSVDFKKPVHKLLFGMMFKSITGVNLAGANNMRGEKQLIKSAKTGDTLDVHFDFICRFLPGTYFITAGLMANVEGEFTFLHRVMDLLAIRVMDGTEMSPYDRGQFSLDASLNVEKRE